MSKWIGMTIAPAVTGRSLLKSPSTQVRSLEGRSLGMSSSLMLSESSRLRQLELGSGFDTASAEQRQPMPRWTLQNRPYVDGAKPAISVGPKRGCCSAGRPGQSEPRFPEYSGSRSLPDRGARSRSAPRHRCHDAQR